MNRNQLLEMFPMGEPFPVDGDRRRFDPVTAISGAIGLGGNLIGGILGKKAAGSASKDQQEAAAAAGKKVEDAAAAANPQITQAAATAGQDAKDAAAKAAAGVSGAATDANKLLNPYLDTGAKASGLLSTALDSSAAPTLDQLQIDPGYAFRTAESQKALTSRAAALGLATGGGTLKAIDRYAQQDASQEYQNAFNRFTTTRQNNISNLLAVSGQGLSASGTAGSNLIGAGKYAGDTGLASTEYAGNLNVNATDRTTQNTIDASRAGADYLTQGANARAAGIVGGANALSSGIAGGANAASGALNLSTLLKNPAAGYVNKLKIRNPSLELGVAA